MKLKSALSPLYLGLALITGGGFVLVGCNEKTEIKTASEQSTYPISATVNLFEVQPVNYKLTTVLPGRVIASEIAEIRPQVSGIILKREFEESSNVTEGQSLYQIDPAIYQAQYDSAVASVASAKANANIAQLTLKRYANLLKTKAISQQDYDKAAADAMQADASVLVAQAAEHTAKVNLEYTKVNSPISGYVGISNVTEGALVSAGQQTALTIVQKLDPIFIDMTQAATTYEKNKMTGDGIYTPVNKVELYFNDGSLYEHEGYIKFSDKSVNQTTGTVTLRSEFPNTDGKILPNMFVKPVYTYGILDKAILLPQKAVTITPAGLYTTVIAKPVEGQDGVYVLEQRMVDIYKGVTGYWILTKGIENNEFVVTEGLINLTNVNFNNPDKKTYVKAVKVDSLTQEQVDKIAKDSNK